MIKLLTLGLLISIGSHAESLADIQAKIDAQSPKLTAALKAGDLAYKAWAKAGKPGLEKGYMFDEVDGLYNPKTGESIPCEFNPAPTEVEND